MKKHLTIGITTALLMVPGIALAKDGAHLEVNSSAEAHMRGADDLQIDDRQDVKIQQVNGEMRHDIDDDNDGINDRNGKPIPTLFGESEGEGQSEAGEHRKNEDHGTTTKSRGDDHRKFGWGFFSKWFGSHDAGPVSMNASSTAGLNAPAAPRFESLLARLSTMFNLNFNTKVKVDDDN